ncbi:MAG TPA: limonene-1,2-epoxide hydrolase family protein [Acidimicrobiales bacterium]|nr:limonene-1,2-epoxide hydrolase family protein [Acidimicrobiales bacterium]
MSDAASIVREFCELMVERDAEALRRFVADDAVYQNTGMDAAVGVDAVIENLAGQFAMFPDSYEYRMQNLAADGNVVMTERLDMIKGPDGSLHGVPVMGTFVVRGGKISRWTDYWDTALPAKMMSGEDVSALVPQSY